MSATVELQRWIGALTPVELAALGRRYQALARAGGAFVMLADGAEIAIPPILTPVVTTAEMRAALAGDARLIVRALSRATRDVIERGDPQLQSLLFSPLSPWERDTMLRTYRAAERLATARVDFLVGSDGKARALEVNATIPAMQGYSDAIAAAFLRAVGEARGVRAVQIDAAIDLNGRNTDDLLASLVSLRAATLDRLAIAIVARSGDAQSGELDHYVQRWRALGHEVWRVTPDQIEQGQSGPIAAGRPADLVYRHVFLRRIDEHSPFGAMMLDAARWGVWNPPASHLEMKGMLALLSEAAQDDGAAVRYGVTDEERRALARRLPWTRLCTPGPDRGPDGSRLTDLVAFTRANQASLVLKRSWDYGGRGVFLGAELDDESSQARLRALTGAAERVDWSTLIDHIGRCGEGWVVQALVDVQPRTVLRVDDGGPQPRELYADLSAFTSLGNDVPIDGGAVRASGGRIVNIQGGGGLAPLLREEGLARLLDKIE